jgi:hypothetical protein
MQMKQVIALAFILVLGYYLGIKYPSLGQSALSKIGA